MFRYSMRIALNRGVAFPNRKSAGIKTRVKHEHKTVDDLRAFIAAAAQSIHCDTHINQWKSSAAKYENSICSHLRCLNF